MVEEMWPRYGSFPGFNPIVELSLTFHNLVVGANGQRQAMFLENIRYYVDVADFVHHFGDDVGLGGEDDEIGLLGGGAIASGKYGATVFIAEFVGFFLGFDSGDDVVFGDDPHFEDAAEEGAAHVAGAEDGDFQIVGHKDIVGVRWIN